MNTQDIGVCSRCGQQFDITEHWAGCISQSWWQNKDKPHIREWVDDDIKIWKISLCRLCQLKGYVDFLSEQIRSSLSILTIGLVTSFVSFAVFVVIRKFYADHGACPEWMRYPPLAIMLITVVFLFHIFLTLVSFRRYLFNRKILLSLKNSNNVPPDKITDAFKGEAQRILAAIEQGRQKDVTGIFVLPIYKEQFEHEKWGKELKGEFIKKHQSRSIAVVAGTRLDLEKHLSSKWKKLLES